MNPVENGLRTALRDLVPEPPDTLAMPEGTYRRATELRRNRRLSVAFGFVLVAMLVGAGITVPASVRRTSQGWTAPGKAGGWPDWPRRGDVTDPAVDQAAIAAWDASLRAQHVTRHREPRVLYAGDVANTIVVLYGLAEVGGERVVVLTRERNGPFSVFYDEGARWDGYTVLSLLVDAPGQQTCGKDTYSARLLVLGAPGTRRAQWRAEESTMCPESRDGEWAEIPLTDGAGLLPIEYPSANRLFVQARGRGSWDSSPVWGGSGWEDVPYRTQPPAKNADEEWGHRHDGSGANLLGFHLPNEDLRRSDGYIALTVSLPDGTGLIVLRNRDKEQVGFYAQDATRGLRRYLLGASAPSAFAVVVDGLEGRWLVFVGRARLQSATLVDGDRRVPIPLEAGWGAIRLDAEPSAGAFAWTSDHDQDMTVGAPILARTGKPVKR